MTVATDKETKRQELLLSAALAILQAGPQSNMSLAGVLGCDGSDLWRILSHCPKVRAVNDGKTLTTWEMVKS